MRTFAITSLLLALTSVAEAHQTSVKYIDLSMHDTQVDVKLRCAATDLTEAMQLPADAKPTVAQAIAHPAVATYVQKWLALSGCTTTRPRARAADATFLDVTWTATCASTSELRLDFAAFFALDQRHEAFVQLAAPGVKTTTTVVRSSERTVVLKPGQARTLLYWIAEGVHHILDFDAKDHVAFVLALLLVVMLYRGAAGWHTLAFWPTLKKTAVVITAFTIAHSISLIAAALGFVSLSPKIVESLIALSIAYTALEDVIKPDVRWRYGLAFGFGLVHGLGFASVLAVQLTPEDVVVPLVCFNLGVELGQLAVVVVALPGFYALARWLGGDRYRRVALPAIALAVFLLGFTMFLERVLEVRILPM